MFYELIAVLVAGVAGAGVVMLLSKASRGRLPRWAIPVGAGLAMLGASIASEYGWYDATARALPGGVEVVETHASSAAWRPWTYAWPMTDRFIAVDAAGRRENAQTPGLYLADLYFFARWHPTQVVEIMVDCPGQRRADPMGGDGGDPRWREVGAEDAILSAVCSERAA
ncbi:hypothetical protein AYJ57_12880 [Salipiger sp. CCB-MM3]|uniref:hypothetical protein n=1 Tax=Salipiger sp. CCB-MM3 TaxID=1792508 RepID=UPI00080ABA84|nr:hypothetical protein [Salipiger sp. CCB-MM3]ANT61183.1 hypothetical protein AYJ57_12880 [Salipiger sp. CCB-MM3]